jgi:hypothetical protein
MTVAPASQAGAEVSRSQDWSGTGSDLGYLPETSSRLVKGLE